MNPRRRRRSRRKLYGAAAAAHSRKIGRRSHRRVRRNPVRARRRRSSPPRMTPAMRSKISRAVKASFRRRRSGGSVVARRSSRRSLVRHTYSAPARRSFRRRSSGGFGGGGLVSSFKRAVSKDLLMKAGGAVVASIGTGMVLQRWGASLPGSASKWGRVAYSVGIPIAAAYLVGKKNRAVAEGMVIGGLVMGINALISQVRATTGTVSAYPQVSDFSVAGELGPATFNYYPTAGNKNLIGTPLSGAFSPSAW